jgi:hypothetical protein
MIAHSRSRGPKLAAVFSIALVLSTFGAHRVDAQRDTLPSRSRKRVADALAMHDHRWIHRSTAHAELYVLAGSRAEKLLPTLPANVERAIDADLAFLGASFSGAKLQILIVGTDTEMTPLIGGSAFGNAEPTEGSAYLVGNDSMPPALRHEVMHLLSWRLWGKPATPWLGEGLAMVAAGGCGGYTPSAIAAELGREGKLVPLETLWHKFNYAWESGALYYSEAASLVDYIDRTYGRTRLRAFWPTGAYDAIKQRLGVDLSTLERDWRADLARQTPSAPWSTVFKRAASRGCE